MASKRPTTTGPWRAVWVILLAMMMPTTTHAFCVGIGSPSCSSRSLLLDRSCSALYMSEPPSDTSSDDDNRLVMDEDEIIEAESEPYTPTTEEEAMVNRILDLMPDGSSSSSSSNKLAMGSAVTEEQRSAINEALYKLESLQSAAAMAQPLTTSPLMNGVWELRYAGGYSLDGAVPSPTRQIALFVYSGGYSPGLFALQLAQQIPFVQVGDLEISISRAQPRIQASVPVKLAGQVGTTVQVQARLETLSDVRMRETYEAATVFDNNVVELPSALQYGRDLYVTYLDEDILVVRDASGIPEVLVRKDKAFAQNWGQEPEAVDNMTAPGQQ